MDTTKKAKSAFAPGDSDIRMRQTDLKTRNIHSLPLEYNKRDASQGPAIIAKILPKKPATDLVWQKTSSLVAPDGPLTKKKVEEIAAAKKTLPLQHALEIRKFAANAVVNGGVDNDEKEVKKEDNVSRLLRVQALLPAMIDVSYRNEDRKDSIYEILQRHKEKQNARDKRKMQNKISRKNIEKDEGLFPPEAPSMEGVSSMLAATSDTSDAMSMYEDDKNTSSSSSYNDE